jgi:hypothetical protein
MVLLVRSSRPLETGANFCFGPIVSSDLACTRPARARGIGEEQVPGHPRVETRIAARAGMRGSADSRLPVSDLSSERQPRWPSVRGRFDQSAAPYSRSLSPGGSAERLQLSPLSLAPDGSWRCPSRSWSGGSGRERRARFGAIVLIVAVVAGMWARTTEVAKHGGKRASEIEPRPLPHSGRPQPGTSGTTSPEELVDARRRAQ